MLADAFYAPAGAAEAVQDSGVFESSCEVSVLQTEWILPREYNFDNIGNSVLILFETATLEMWQGGC